MTLSGIPLLTRAGGWMPTPIASLWLPMRMPHGCHFHCSSFFFFFFFISWQDNQLVCLFTGLGCPFKLWSLVESFWRIFYRVVKSPWWVSVTAGKCFFGVTGNSSVPFFLFKQNICISLYFEILGFTTFFLLRKYSALKKEKLENHRNYSYQ